MPSDIKLFNEDCMPAMQKMKDKQFDLAIVDPPYRDENQPTQDMRENNMIKNFGKKPKEDFFDELKRTSVGQIIWGANNFGFEFKGFVVWRKGVIPENFTMSMCEIASLSDNVGTVAKITMLPCTNQDRIHPTQKPVALYKWLLKNYAKPGDKILDTHLGSGSIAIACYDMGHDLCGYEIDKQYFDAASKRLENHKKQLTLF